MPPLAPGEPGATGADAPPARAGGAAAPEAAPPAAGRAGAGEALGALPQDPLAEPGERAARRRQPAGLDAPALRQLVGFQWKLGIAVGADSCKSLRSPRVTVALRVADGSGSVTCRTFEMTVPQFQNFYSQFKEMASVLETF
ncbi:COMM domain-containing protein 6 [Liasis olivaceus]